jgi:hypothetical protein
MDVVVTASAEVGKRMAVVQEISMEYRLLGGSGLKVPALIFGSATFGGGHEFFRKWGVTGVAEVGRVGLTR